MNIKVFFSELPYSFKYLSAFFYEIKIAFLLSLNQKILNCNGVKLYNQHSITISLKKIILKQNWEKGEADLLRKYLTPGERILELGAGLGYISIVAAKITGPANVLTYEANPALIPIIIKNHTLNNVTINPINKILINKKHNEKTLKFNISPNFVESSSVYKSSANISTIDVQTEYIEDVLNNFKPVMLLIDIEGAECDLLDFIIPDYIKKIILDTHPFFNEIGDEKNSQMIKNLLNQGFILNSNDSYGFVLFFSRN